MSEDNIRKYYKTISGTFVAINLLKIVYDLNNFRKWIKDYHSIDNDEDLLPGYRLFVILLLKDLLDSIEWDSGLKLKEDFIYNRADFKGVPLEDLPNSCEKTIILKNIWALSNNIYTSKNWSRLQSGLKDIQKLFPIFDYIYDNCILTDGQYDKSNILNALTQDHLLIKYHDTHRGFPLARLDSPVIIPHIRKGYINDAFKGYVYTLQYVWYTLYSEERFEQLFVYYLDEIFDPNSKYIQALKEFKNNKKIGYKKKGTVIDDILHIDFDGAREEVKKILGSNYKPSDDLLNDENFLVDKSIPDAKKWRIFDIFWDKIHEEIVHPLKGLQIKFIQNKSIDVIPNEQIYNPLLSKVNLKEPRYLSGHDKTSLKKQLDLKLLWYPLNVLDLKDTNLFNGVPAFRQLLAGSINLKEFYEIDEKTQVRVFKHPARKGYYNYSFAILVECSSNLFADYSGWLIFYDCATDHTGYGGSNLLAAREVLERYANVIEKDEFIIDGNVFLEYIQENNVTPKTSVETVEDLYINDFFESYSRMRGKLFEYVFANLAKETDDYKEVICDYWVANQIDCIGLKDDNKIDLFECKLNIHTSKIKDDIEQILKKNKRAKKKICRTYDNPPYCYL
jgi:hypothetical protein